jgi:hypothetical protein
MRLYHESFVASTDLTDGAEVTMGNGLSKFYFFCFIKLLQY